MFSILTSLSLRTWLIIGAVGAVLAAAGAIYAKGRLDATSATTIEQQSKTIETLRDRSKTNAEINSADDARLCAALGGVFDSAAASVWDGWEKQTPSAQTRDFIVKNDRPFAVQVGSHNEFGHTKGCWG